MYQTDRCEEADYDAGDYRTSDCSGAGSGKDDDDARVKCRGGGSDRDKDPIPDSLLHDERSCGLS